MHEVSRVGPQGPACHIALWAAMLVCTATKSPPKYPCPQSLPVLGIGFF